MSETKTEQKDTGIIIKLTGEQKRRVFMTILPWAIIAVLTIATAGIITGWTLRSADQSRIESAASALVQTVSKNEVSE